MSKKLVYVFTTTQHPGLLQKILGQLEAFEALFDPVVFIDIPPLTRASFLRKIWTGLLLVIKALMSIRTDIYYVRYNPKLFLLNTYLMVISYGIPVYFEHNVVFEYELSVLNQRSAYWLNKITLFALRFTPIEHVCVSRGIQQSLLRAHMSPNAISVIQNGYKIADISSRLDPELISRLEAHKKRYKKLGVLIGSGYAWHGLTTIIDRLNAFPDVGIVVIGPYQLDATPPPSVCMLGKLPIDVLHDVYQYVDFGIGPMNWDMIGAKDGSPLKTREYLCMGLPVLINYHDLAQEIPELRPYLFNLQDNPRALEDLLTTSLDREAIQGVAIKHLSWHKTLAHVLEHMQKKTSLV